MSDNNSNIFNNTTYESKPELFLIHEGCIIDDDTYVTVNEYTQYDEYYFDILLHKKKEIIPLGRYIKEHKVIRIKYNDGKIMLYYSEYNPKNSDLSRITKIINLYNVKDDMFYNLTEIEALYLFNPSIDSIHLDTPNNRLVQFNADKKQKVLSKGINRFSYYGD